MATITTPKPGHAPPIDGGNGSNGHWDGDGSRQSGSSLPIDTGRLGMLLALAGISMMFVALTSAYVVRQGLDPGWRNIQMPGLLIANTAILLASSLSMEMARRSRRSAAGHPGTWLSLTLLLGLLFLGGQLEAWRQLAAKGIFLSTNPHSSFFYLLTGLHGLHLAGGILALGFLVLAIWRPSVAPAFAGLPTSEIWFTAARRDRWVDVTALYWHFMDGLWVYLVLLLFWR